MATFLNGFGLQETTPTPLGGSAATQPAPYATVAVVPAVPAIPANPGCPAYALGAVVTPAYVAAHPGTAYVANGTNTLAEAWRMVPATPMVPAVPAFNPSKDGFGVPLATVIVYPTVDTNGDGYLDFAGGVVNPRDGFGLPMNMIPAVSSTPQPTGVYSGYGKLA